jgi:hypothetical protein
MRASSGSSRRVTVALALSLLVCAGVPALAPAQESAQEQVPADFEVTSEGRPLHLDTLHLIIQVDEPDLYQVLQFMTVTNAGEKAWAGGPALRDGRPAGIVIPLPLGATTVRSAPFPNPEDALPSDLQIDADRVMDPRPVPPGGRQVAVTYDLRGEGEPVLVDIEVPYPAQSVSVLLGGAAAQGIEIRDSNLQQQPDEQIGDQQFALWTGEALAPGSRVQFTLGPVAEPLSTRNLAIAGFGLALILAAAATLRGDPMPPDAAGQRRRMVAEIAELDLLHDREEIGAAEYFQRRGSAIEYLSLLDEALARAEAGRGSLPPAGASAGA